MFSFIHLHTRIRSRISVEIIRKIYIFHLLRKWRKRIYYFSEREKLRIAVASCSDDTDDNEVQAAGALGKRQMIKLYLLTKWSRNEYRPANRIVSEWKWKRMIIMYFHFAFAKFTFCLLSTGANAPVKELRQPRNVHRCAHESTDSFDNVNTSLGEKSLSNVTASNEWCCRKSMILPAPASTQSLCL